MTDRRKIELIKKNLGKDRFNKILKDIPPHIKSEQKRLLNSLLDDFYDLEILIENEIMLMPMPHTEFLNFIMSELDRQGATWNGAKGFFKLLVPNEEWEEHKKSWFGWLNPKIKDSAIRKKIIKTSIQDRLNFSPNLWDSPEATQIKIMTQKVKEFLENRDNNQKKSILNLSSLIKTEPKITQEQQELLQKFKSQSSIEELVSTNNQFFLEEKINQAFLLELILILYSQSHFTLLYQVVLPSLFPRHRNKFEIKKIEADVLTNLKNPNYDKIIDLLETIECSTAKETADIQTMIISNAKRCYINSTTINQEDLEKLLLSFSLYYNKVYEAIRPYDYYPAVNLAYMTTLLNAISPTHQKANSYDLQTIYKRVQKESIKTDKQSKDKNSKYYATITDLEFRLLLGEKRVMLDVDIMLDELNPPVRMIEQTLGQMRWFLEVLEKFSRRDVFLDEFVRVVDLLEDYKYVV